MSQEPSCWQWTGRETLSLVAFINVFTPWQNRRPGLARLSPPSTPGSLGVSFCVCLESSLGVSAWYAKTVLYPEQPGCLLREIPLSKAR